MKIYVHVDFFARDSGHLIKLQSQLWYDYFNYNSNIYITLK